MTVLAANVADQDTDDPPDTMAANSTFSFSTAGGAVGGNVVVSEIYGGGGNSGATLTHDFIELFNRTAAPIDLAGWSVQYASAAGATWQVTHADRLDRARQELSRPGSRGRRRDDPAPGSGRDRDRSR